MKTKIAVLGSGMVGRTISYDLSKDYDITTFDISLQNLLKLKKLNSQITIQIADLKNFDNYDKLLSDFNYVISAVPGFMGYETLKKLIQLEKNVCDISFFPEDSLTLNKLAKEKNVTVITDMGVAPGMSNLLLGYYNENMKVDSFEFYVGGLPVTPIEPFKYKAPFSPIDVIEEYTRPARIMEDGKISVKPALSEEEIINFPEIGELEGFYTDGLRSLLTTMSHIPNMKEKTLRYPGHLSFIKNLNQAGFFSDKKLYYHSVTPLEITSELLINQWRYDEGEKDLTIMKVIIENKNEKIEYELLDYYDSVLDLSSMSRTTGYVCCAGINLIINNLFNLKGVFPPELVGKNKKCFQFVMDYLDKRNVKWIKK